MQPSAGGAHYIGLMSGTSLDAVDGVLLTVDPQPDGARLGIRAHASVAMPAALRALFYALNSPGDNELHRAAVASHQLMRLYASVCHDLLTQTDLKPAQVQAIGAHGQTVRHHPPGSVFQGQPVRADDPDCPPYTLQLNQPALLAEWTGIPVVADFRSADMAAGGQGAPLVPVFHQAVFGQVGRSVAVVNIGGIANITGLCAHGEVWGLDTGPGNMLLDTWCQRHTGQPYDADGAWGASGTSLPALLTSLMSDPYFARVGAKSTGRDLFNADWLARHLARLATPPAPQDVQATLAQLTIQTIVDGLRNGPWHGAAPTQVWICGGGARNRQLMRGLEHGLPHTRVASTDQLGWPVDQVEAAAFAWLAREHMEGRHLTGLPAVTGALAARRLGALYPAPNR